MEHVPLCAAPAGHERVRAPREDLVGPDAGRLERGGEEEGWVEGEVGEELGFDVF